MDPSNLKLTVESLQNLMVAIGRGNDRANPDFIRLRGEILAIPELKPHLPDFVITCRNGAQFWAYIKGKAGQYSGRDQHIWAGFGPVFSYLENRATSPATDEISQILQVFDSEHVHSAWQKALARKTSDPEAALTSARTLLESTCKHILDSLAISYNDTADLPDLYSAVAKGLNPSPSQHIEQILKQVLGGCHSVIQGLGAMRNRLGDAHGKGTASYKPQPRHAALAVNLSGAMAMFLVETLEARKEAAS